MCQYTTLWNVSVLKATLKTLVNGVAILSASSSSKADNEHLMLNLHDETVKAYFIQ